jgi:uncharacterized protein YjdB
MFKLSDILSFQIERRITSQSVLKKSDSYYGENTMSKRQSNSVKSKILAYLSKDSGYNTLTVAKMQSVFGVANPTATINDLRNDGHAIYLNTRTNTNGDKVSFYRLGSPTKRMVAAGIAAIRQQGERAFA